MITLSDFKNLFILVNELLFIVYTIRESFEQTVVRKKVFYSGFSLSEAFFASQHNLIQK